MPDKDMYPPKKPVKKEVVYPHFTNEGSELHRSPKVIKWLVSKARI